MNRPVIHYRPLSYQDQLVSRKAHQIDLLVIHCTELPDLDTARMYGEKIHYGKTSTGNSGHFYINRNGDLHQWVELSRVAHHVKAFNHRSVGVELINLGRYPNWLDSRHQEMKEAYSDEQISSLIDLVHHLQEELENLRWVAGHEDLDVEKVPASDDTRSRVYRKRDPGPLFPWPRLLAEVRLNRVRSAATLNLS